MKKIIWFIIPVLLLVSCAPDYHNKIIGRGVATVSCSMVPINDSLKSLIDSGFFNVNAGAGNPMICDSVYTVQFTTYQQWESGHKGFLIAGILVLIIGFGIFIYLNNRGTGGMATLYIAFGALLIGGPLVGAFYYFNPDREIKKIDYVHYIQKDGDLHNFWPLPAQFY